jgi:hypothetical protein
MSRESTCRCLVCGLERSLTEQLAEPSCEKAYREFANSHSLLSAFSSPLKLISYLHTNRSANNGTHSADGILAELLHTSANDVTAAPLRDVLLLAFIPMLHSASRQVSVHYPSLSPDDIAQHVVAALLEILGDPKFYGRTSHVAFAISRILKRNAFEWAQRECRSPVYGAAMEILAAAPSTHSMPEPLEPAAVLQHFLYRCQQRGLLTGEDLELLVQWKLETAREANPGAPALLYSNASRQRMKRLLGKLRRIARTPARKTQNDNQLRLF